MRRYVFARHTVALGHADLTAALAVENSYRRVRLPRAPGPAKVTTWDIAGFVVRTFDDDGDSPAVPALCEGRSPTPW